MNCEWLHLFSTLTQAPEKAVIAVHPVYGSDMVSREVFDSYMDGLFAEWMRKWELRVLITASNDSVINYAGKPDFMLSSWPRLDNTTGLVIREVALIGSTAKSVHEMEPGCVDKAKNALLLLGYAATARIIETGTLYPGETK